MPDVPTIVVQRSAPTRIVKVVSKGPQGIQGPGGSVSFETLSQLDASDNPAFGYFPTGYVYNDADVSKNGIYTWSGSDWVKSRGLADQVAKFVISGGTANAITATVQAGVDPGTVLFFALTPNAANTGAVTLNGKPVRDRSGSVLPSGALSAGSTYLLIDQGSEYRVMVNNFAAIADVAGLQGSLDGKLGTSSGSLTLTVGPGGTYGTINAALEQASKSYALYKSFGFRVTILLKSGFVMAEQVFVFGVDMSYVTIEAEDAEVTIQRSALINQPSILNWRSGTFPAFAAVRNAGLPIIKCLFSMDSSGAASGRVGIIIKENSFGTIERGAGIKNCPWRGLYIDHGLAYARQTIWDGSGLAAGPDGSRGAAIRPANGAVVNVRDSQAIGSGTALYASQAVVVALNCNFSGCVAGANSDGTAIYLDAVSQVYAETVNVSGAAGHGIYTKGGSTIFAASANASNCGGYALTAEESSEIQAEGANCSGSGRAVSAATGALIRARNANLSGAKTRAVSVSTGARVDVSGSDATNALVTSESTALQLYSGGKLDFVGGSVGHNIRAGTTTAHITMEADKSCVADITGLVDDVGGAIRTGNMPIGRSYWGHLTNIENASGVDIGNVSVVLTAASDSVQIINTPLTTSREIRLPSPSVGKAFCISRLPGSTDSGGVIRYANVSYPGGTVLAALAVGQWCIVAPSADRTSWVVVQRGGTDNALIGFASINPAAMATGTFATFGTVTVAGAAVGDRVDLFPPSTYAGGLQGIRVWADVTAADTVTIYGRNDTGSTIDLATGSWRVRVSRFLSG